MTWSSPNRLHCDWKSVEPTDMLGSSFELLDIVAKGSALSCWVGIEIGKVTRIAGGKIYLSESKVAIRYPGRLLNLSKLPGKMDHPVRV